jgi:2-polyprenyl-3-methyl-5-hydroxy-6-metoxy-1,4-benzoquinol methylase
MSANAWSHNIHYHPFVLQWVPPACGRALDVGCGTGLLARRLAEQCGEVVAIDRDRDTLARARSASSATAHIRFVEADVMDEGLPHGSFDLITAIATLHHLPLTPALARFRDLLKPGGILTIIGLYRVHSPVDYAWAAVALPATWVLRCVRGQEEVGAPLREPAETLREIRAACEAILPGCRLRRRLFFRYSLVWRKPV